MQTYRQFPFLSGTCSPSARRLDALLFQFLADALIAKGMFLVFGVNDGPNQVLELLIGDDLLGFRSPCIHQEGVRRKGAPFAGNVLVAQSPADGGNAHARFFCQVRQLQRLPVSWAFPEKGFLVGHQGVEHQYQGMVPLGQELLELPGLAQLLFQVVLYLVICSSFRQLDVFLVR